MTQQSEKMSLFETIRLNSTPIQSISLIGPSGLFLRNKGKDPFVTELEIQHLYIPRPIEVLCLDPSHRCYHRFWADVDDSSYLPGSVLEIL